MLQLKHASSLAMLATSSIVGLFVFTTPATASPFEFEQKLLAPDSASRDQFGLSVAVDGDYALIGSRLDDDNGRDSGSAYLFDVTSGELVQKLPKKWV